MSSGTGVSPANPGSNNPPPSGTTPTPSGSSGGTGANAPTAANTNTPSNATQGPNNMTFTECLVADPSWPSTLILDLGEGNWIEWSRHLTLLSARVAVSKYLNGTLTRPDPAIHPDASQIWDTNDGSLRAFMLERVASTEYDHASAFDTSHTVFEALRTRHEKLGPHAQINLLLKEFTISYEPSIPMTTTSKQLRDLHERMKKMGKIDEDHLFLFVIINALGRHYPQLQSEIHKATDDPNFNSNAALRRIETEAALTERRAEVGVGSSTVALVGTTRSNDNANTPSVICSNCKHPHHTIEFCIKKGGKMAGRTLDEAKAAQRAAAGKTPQSAPIIEGNYGRCNCKCQRCHYGIERSDHSFAYYRYRCCSILEPYS